MKKLREYETRILDKAKQDNFKFKGYDIKLYQWGKGPYEVLLIHGWEGQAGNFADLIERLLQHDFKVYAFDAPSHGYSSKGKTSLFEFTELVAVLIKKFHVKNLVSHSFGGVATTYALFSNQDIVIEKYILLTTPDRFIDQIQDVSEKLGITKKVEDRLITRLTKETGQDVYALNVSDFVKQIRVKQALIIHDRHDRVIPIYQSKHVHQNWPPAKLMEIEGTGHFRILSNHAVIGAVIGFLQK